MVFKNSVIADNQFNVQIHKKMEDGSAPENEFVMKLFLGTSEVLYQGEYVLHRADKTTSKESAEGGNIVLKAGEYAEVIGLVGGNLIKVSEVDPGENYGQPSYEMTGALVTNSVVTDESGVSGIALEGKALSEAEGVVKVQVTNRRKPSVTIKKQVEGNMGDRNAEFAFEITVKDSNNSPVNVDGTYDGITVSGGSFKLKDDNSFTIPNLPIGSTITVTETTQGDGYTTTVTAGSQTGTNTITISPKGAVEILFTNTKGVNIPTGLPTDYYPYWMMFAAAILGFTGFIYPTCRRRRHRGDK